MRDIEQLKACTATVSGTFPAVARELIAIGLLGRELYRAQKRAGAEYRQVLATELERAGYTLERGVMPMPLAQVGTT